jgi:hypothetical protein
MQFIPLEDGVRAGSVILSRSQLDFLSQQRAGRRSLAQIRRAFRQRYSDSELPVSTLRFVLAEMNREENALHDAAPFSRIATHAEPMRLSNHRKADGGIDWETVRGYVDFKEEARRAAREALRGR